MSSSLIPFHFIYQPRVTDSARLAGHDAPGCPPLCLPSAKMKSKWPRLPRFDVGAGDMNPSPHSWTASALLSEPSP